MPPTPTYTCRMYILKYHIPIFTASHIANHHHFLLFHYFSTQFSLHKCKAIILCERECVCMLLGRYSASKTVPYLLFRTLIVRIIRKIPSNTCSICRNIIYKFSSSYTHVPQGMYFNCYQYLI